LTSPPSEPSLDEAPILHVDLDAFFASVEILDDPTLAGRPVAVGGAGARGVVASASYEARRYGVRSAMPSVTARRLCPDLVMLPGRFDRYEEYSVRFHSLVADLTPVYEPLGLDEVFCDLSGLHRRGALPLEAARALRARLHEELSLTCGIGVARNKLFAKLASRRAKPRVEAGRLVEGPGVLWVSPELERRWLAELPVEALWGVGPATARRLAGLGLRHVRDLAALEPGALAAHLGEALASTLESFARGEDPREVQSDRRAKSLGHEETFARSRQGLAELDEDVRRHAAVVARALRERDLVARTLSIVVRFDDLTGVTRAQTLPFGLDDESAIYEIGSALLEAVELRQAVRLFGLSASTLRAREGNMVQLSFTLDSSGAGREAAAERGRVAQAERAALRDALDEIRQRYGRAAIGHVAELSEDGLDLARQRGRAAFGPEG
jgi:DNA polymerase-4